MNWTVAVITDGKSPQRMFEIAKSVCTQPGNLFNRQLLVVGGEDPHCNSPNFKWISFDEKQKEGWITRKKNIACQEAMFENICLLHDYIALDDNWFREFELFGEDWSHCVCRIEHQNGVRGRDWVTFDTTLPLHHVSGNIHIKTIRYIDYNDLSQTRNQYISGQAYCIKKDWALKYPLDENKVWGQSEDVAHAFQVRNIWNLKMNPKSIFRYLKPKDEDNPWPPRTDEFNFKQNGGIDGI